MHPYDSIFYHFSNSKIAKLKENQPKNLNVDMVDNYCFDMDCCEDEVEEEDMEYDNSPQYLKKDMEEDDCEDIGFGDIVMFLLKFLIRKKILKFLKKKVIH